MFFNPSRLEVAYCIVSFLLDFEDTMLKLKSPDQPQSGLGSFISSSKLTGYCLTLIILILVNLVDESDGGPGGQDLGLPSVAAHATLIHRFPQKIRHVRGKYKHKEEVVKKIEHDHPCKLTEAAVKITFPGMKDQVLVSFLGYKEPNLVPVLRCKGLCGNEALSPVACVPTKLRYRKVKMQIKTQYLGHESKEKYRELVLEEHEECGCRCLNVRPEHCMEPSLFNNETCSCKCDTSLYNRDQIRCETFNDRTWDPVTCTCRHIEEGRLLDGPKQGDDARKAAEAAGINPGDGQYHDHRHHHKKSSRPGHDVDPAVVSWVGEDELGKTRVAVMPKHAQNSSLNNGWMAIAICTFLVIVFATTTVYYWQKAKKMAKDLFAEKEANEDDDEDDDDDDIEVPSPPPKPSGKKPFDDNETALNSPLSLQKVMLNNHNQIGRIKSPVEIVKKLCDSKSKLSNHVNMHPKGSSSSHLLLNGLVKGSPKILNKSGSKSKIIDPNEENARMMIESSDSEPELELNGAASDSPEAAEAIEVTMATAPHKNLMELLLAAAAKRDNSNKHQYHNQSNGIAKAASMSELEASQLEPDHHHRSQNLQPNHHRSHHHHHHHHDHDHRQVHNHRNGASSRSVNHHKSNFSVNREIVTTRVSNQSSNARQHKRSTSNYNNDELEAIEHAMESDLGPPCNECVHASLLRPTATTASTHSKRPPARNQQPPQPHNSRHLLQHQHSFHHPHPPQPPSEAVQPQHSYRPQHHNSHTLDRRHHRRSNASSATRPRSRLYHGSFGQLLDDEDLLQQCLATLMMDAAILRQQQQIQQEQLQLQQEQLQQQQSVIEKQKYAKSMKVAAASKAAEAAEATDTQSVIESIAGDGATVITVDRLEVSVEVVDDGEQSPGEDQGGVLDDGLDRGC